MIVASRRPLSGLLLLLLLLVACTPAPAASPTDVPPPKRSQHSPPQSVAAARDNSTTMPQDDGPPDETVDARLLRRVVRARTETGEVYVESEIEFWITDDAVRTKKGALGVAPPIDLLWRQGEGTWWVFDHAVCPWFASTDGRGHISQELRIPRGDDGELEVPDPVLTKVPDAWANPEDDGLPGTEVYRVGPKTRKGMTTFLWVSTDTPLSGRDFADELRRRLSPPWSADLQRLFAAFDQLPGYPVAFRSEMGSYAVVEIGRAQIPASELSSGDRHRSDNCNGLFTEDVLARYKAERDAGREHYGLDSPFTPSTGDPFPPSLPGGSCKPRPETCVEAWNGVETQFLDWCEPSQFDFYRPCPRDGVAFVCEGPQRETLIYRYGGRNGGRECPEGTVRFDP